MKHLKTFAIVSLVLLVCAVGLLCYKRTRTAATGSVEPVAEKEVFTGRLSRIGESLTVGGAREEADTSRMESPVTASKTNDNHVVAISVPDQYAGAEGSDGAATISMPDGGHSQIAGDESPESNSKVGEDEAVQDAKIYITAARADLEAKNVPVGERTAKTSIQGDEIIVIFSPRPGERAGDFIVRVDRATGKVIDTKIWR